MICAFFSLFFSGIVLFLLFGVFFITASPAFIPIIVFTGISLLTMTLINTFGAQMLKRYDAGFFWATELATGLFVTVQLISTLIFILLPFLTSVFVAMQMVFIFLYLLIVLPILAAAEKDMKDRAKA